MEFISSISTTADHKLILTEEEEQEAVNSFRKLIQFPTVSGTGPSSGAYDNCATWIIHYLEHLVGIWGYILEESKANKPIVVGVWEGSDTSLPGILLNSHYDVVPVANEYWTVPPFDAVMEGDRIYGRGCQDMKCVCAQYLIALAKLRRTGFEPNRSIYVTFLPDEEIGGVDGMNVLTESDWFNSIKVAVALDEGLASEGDDFKVFYGERLPWWVRVKAAGNTGHGSRFIDGTAIEQVVDVTNRALKFRQEQRDILHGSGHHAGCSHAVAKKVTLGDVTSLNVTMLRAGVVSGGNDVINVVPPSAEAGFDIRISPHMDPRYMADALTLWCEEATASARSKSLSEKETASVSWEYYYDPVQHHALTSTDPNLNPWWTILTTSLQKHFEISVTPEVFPAATDSRFLRALGLKAFGFSPMRRSPILLHEHDEYIDRAVFIEGCNVYLTIIRALSSQESGEIDKL